MANWMKASRQGNYERLCLNDYYLFETMNLHPERQKILTDDELRHRQNETSYAAGISITCQVYVREKGVRVLHFWIFWGGGVKR
jgi:hypothetical protein